MKVFNFIVLGLIGLATATSQAASLNEALSKPSNLSTPERSTVTATPSISSDPRLVPTNFVARLIVQLPTSLNQAPEAINGVAMTALSLTGLAVNPDMLQDAWVSFDSQHQQWKALWPKPPMFHFGMILLPALVSKLSNGQTFNFESQGQNASLMKDGKGQLLVKRGEATAPLTASDLRELLRARVTSDGMSLFLDKAGNLVLEATGSRALALANVKASK